MKSIKVGRERITFRDIIVLLIFCSIYVIAVKLILSEYYFVYSEPIISYEKSFSLFKLPLCFLVIIALYIFTLSINTTNKINDYSIKILFILYTVPTIMSYCLFQYAHILEFWLISICYWLSLCLCSKYLILDFRKTKYTIKSQKLWCGITILLLIWGIVYFFSKIQGFRFSLSLSNVYDTRQKFKDSSNDWMVFFKTALGEFICPCFVVYSIEKKSYIKMVISILLQIALFSLAKDKIFLLLILMAIVFGFFGKKICKSFHLCLGIGMGGVACLNIIAIWGIMQNLIFNIFVRRFFVIPSWLNYLYFDFFFSSSKIGWKQDTFLIDKLFTPVYTENVPELISKQYFNNAVSNPNAGMLAEAYSRFGILGIVIYPILIVMLFNIFNYFFKDSSDSVKLTVSFSLAIILCNDVITSTSFVMSITIVLLCSFIFKEEKTKFHA